MCTICSELVTGMLSPPKGNHALQHSLLTAGLDGNQQEPLVINAHAALHPAAGKALCCARLHQQYCYTVLSNACQQARPTQHAFLVTSCGTYLPFCVQLQEGRCAVPGAAGLHSCQCSMSPRLLLPVMCLQGALLILVLLHDQLQTRHSTARHTAARHDTGRRVSGDHKTASWPSTRSAQ